MRGPAARRRATVQRGAGAEAAVALWLETQGWAVLARNWRIEGGELDLIVARAGTLRFVEVKARASGTVDPMAALGPAQQHRLRRTAEAWLVGHPGPWAEMAFAVAFVDDGGLVYVDDAF
jgi:putative endonuclease